MLLALYNLDKPCILVFWEPLWSKSQRGNMKIACMNTQLKTDDWQASLILAVTNKICWNQGVLNLFNYISSWPASGHIWTPRILLTIFSMYNHQYTKASFWMKKITDILIWAYSICCQNQPYLILVLLNFSKVTNLTRFLPSQLSQFLPIFGNSLQTSIHKTILKFDKVLN